jgi:hypothetical protein
MQAIETKYHGPTNFRGSRVSARCEAGSITLPWDHALSGPENHLAACKALLVKLGWLKNHVWIGGSAFSLSRGFVFVCYAYDSDDHPEGYISF